MAENETNEEQPIFKINDRRQFNPDGSLREGVQREQPSIQSSATLNTAPTTPAASASATASAAPTEATASAAAGQQSQTQASVAAAQTSPQTEPDLADDEPLDESQIPGAEDPASFANFLFSLVSQAASALGLAENPMTGKRQADLELGKYWIDVLGMLRDKTEGNLHPQEQKLFDRFLGELRMQYVALTRQVAAQAKGQQPGAGGKVSARDILGR